MESENAHASHEVGSLNPLESVGKQLDKRAVAAMRRDTEPIMHVRTHWQLAHNPILTNLMLLLAGEELDKRAAAAMGRDIERIMREQAAREAARSDQKAVWRALALAAAGESRHLLR